MIRKKGNIRCLPALISGRFAATFTH